MIRQNIMFYFLSTIVLSIFLACFPAEGKAQQVVVVPLSSTPSVSEHQLYIPAVMFRPVLAATAWSFEEEGAMINPNGASWWVAPLLLPVGSRILSLELLWKNNVFNSSISTITLHLFNLGNGHGADTYTTNSSVATEGVQRTTIDNINFTVTETLATGIRVYLGHSERWLMGARVVYEN